MDRQQPDGRPGLYYVSIVDGRRRALALGPFRRHRRALGLVTAVRLFCRPFDTWHSWAYGTVRLPLTGNPPIGKLNERMHVGPDRV